MRRLMPLPQGDVGIAELGRMLIPSPPSYQDPAHRTTRLRPHPGCRGTPTGVSSLSEGSETNAGMTSVPAWSIGKDGSDMAVPIRVGAVSYLNAKPLCHRLEA